MREQRSKKGVKWRGKRTICLSPREVIADMLPSRIQNEASVEGRGILQLSCWEELRPIHNICRGEEGRECGHDFALSAVVHVRRAAKEEAVNTSQKPNGEL